MIQQYKDIFDVTRHGDDIYSLAETLNIDMDEIVDFSSTINPVTMPKSVLGAIKEGMPHIMKYPDPEARLVTREISRHYDIPASSILCGNGSTELIHLIIKALQPERLLLFAPTYQEYERAFNIHQKLYNPKASVEYITLKANEEFVTDIKKVISSITGGKDIDTLRRSPVINTPDMVIICNPNNPTGGLMGRDELLEIANVARLLKIYLILDEAYIDFCPTHSLIRDVVDNPYLIIIRSLSVFYALAGLRLGFAVMHPSVIDKFKRLRQPYSINIFAQLAATAAINDKNHTNQTISLINEEKITLEDGFKAIKIRYFPSACNFYLIHLQNAQEVLESLRQKAIILRSCSDFKGLDERYIRITVRSYRDNMRLLKELARILV
ncbi:MAG: threonine-phosphate decarboxylase [Thermodesulfovibrionales bacterium]